jgi:hypothetical protein
MRIPGFTSEGAPVRQIRASSAALACSLTMACLQVAAAAEDVGSCAGIDDDAARLACYDRIAGRSQAAAGTIVAAAPTAPATPADVPVPAVTEAGAQDFGLSEADKKARDPQKYGASSPDSITRTVRTVAKDGYGRFTITLDDGQVWTQVEMEAAVAHPRPGDVVTISRASLGSFKLRSDRTSLTRVRRVK